MAPAHYSPGQLQQPVSRIRPTRVADGAGGYSATEVTTGPHFAFVRPLRGDERQVDGGVSNTQEVLFVLYAAVDIMSTDILLYNGKRYDIRSINPAGLSQFQEIEAVSGGAGA